MNKLTPHIINVVEKMMQCREADGLGYRKFACPNHPKKVRVVPHSCKTSICSSCAKIQNDIWAEEMKNIFPRMQYLHITLTMPQEFRAFFGEEDLDWKRKSDLYDLGWKAIKGFFKTKKIISGCISVLHTFGRALNFNPHLHIIVPAGGLEFDGNKYIWRKISHIPKDYLAKAWTYNLLEYVLEKTTYFKNHILEIMNLVRNKNNLDIYKKLLMKIKKLVPAYEEDKWVKVLSLDYYVNVGKKKAYAQTICYVGRYTRRLPIAKSKIINWDEENEIVTWRHHPHNQPSPVDTILHAHDFINRLITHIRPKHFRLVRYCGIFSTKNRPKFDPILRKLCDFDDPKPIPSWRERQLAYTGVDPLICSCCKKEMELIEKAYKTASGLMKVVHVTKD